MPAERPIRRQVRRAVENKVVRGLTVAAVGLALASCDNGSLDKPTPSVSSSAFAAGSEQSFPGGKAELTKVLAPVAGEQDVEFPEASPLNVCNPDGSNVIPGTPGANGDHDTWKQVKLTAAKDNVQKIRKGGAAIIYSTGTDVSALLPENPDTTFFAINPGNPNEIVTAATIGPDKTCFALGIVDRSSGKPKVEVVFKTNAVQTNPPPGIPTY